MICISKEEAKQIRKIMPNVFIMRTMKQKSSRGRCYVEETPKVLACLEQVRNNPVK